MADTKAEVVLKPGEKLFLSCDYHVIGDVIKYPAVNGEDFRVLNREWTGGGFYRYTIEPAERGN